MRARWDGGAIGLGSRCTGRRHTVAAKKKKKKYRSFWLFVRLQLVLFLLVVAACGYYFYGRYGQEIQALQEEAKGLVQTSSPETFRGSQTSIVYAADGSVISTLKGAKESYYLKREEIPPNVVAAITSIEDKKFYRHDGVDYQALLRAAKVMVQRGKITQGGSTITMQLARNVFISQEKTWQRKAQEIFIAWNLEKKYSKDEILEFYLNNIYFGNGYYGIQSASRGYFNREVGELSLSQSAFLCAIPNNPTLYDPVSNMENTVSRRDRILSNMLEDGKISETDYAGATAERIRLERPVAMQKRDYVETYTYYCATRALMEQAGFVFRYDFSSPEDKEAYDAAYTELYEDCQKKLYTGGYQIYTSLDLAMEEELQRAVDDALSGFEETNEEGVYALQASAVCIDNENGYVRAIVGGREQDFAGYTLNRAYQSFRQPGSSIKPLTVYTPSFERNYTPESIVVDEPIADGPQNANGTYVGEVTVRRAVEKSINTIAWKLYEELSPERGLSYLREMNFSRLDEEDYRPATALGGFTNGASALEMASGYAAIANDGMYRTPTCIVKILDAAEREVYVSEQREKIVYRQNAARIMTDVLTGVFSPQGTARGLGLKNMPCAGKTGTTNDSKDGWFVGYTRYYTTSVWVGYDIPKKMKGLAGSTYPGKIWQAFMEEAHIGKEPLGFLPYVKLPDESSGEDPEEAPEGAAEETPGAEIPEGAAGEDLGAQTPEGAAGEDLGAQAPEADGAGSQPRVEEPENQPGAEGGVVPENLPPQ